MSDQIFKEIQVQKKMNKYVSDVILEYYELCQKDRDNGKKLVVMYSSGTTVGIRYIFKIDNGFYYSTRRNGRRGRALGSPDNIKRIAILDDNKNVNKFSPLTWEQFWKKIDSRFMSKEKAREIFDKGIDTRKVSRWNFRRITGKGRGLMERFLEKFKNVNKVTPYHSDSKYGYKILSEKSRAWGHRGRDISISHQTNVDCVFWSSEYPGCGNGAYYLVANEKEVLFLEYD